MRLLTQFVAAISPPIIPYILLCSLFFIVPSLCSPLTVSDLVSHPRNTTGKITILYIFILYFLTASENTKYY
jgi:hypothetical protein